MNALGALRSRCYDVLNLPTLRGLGEALRENRMEINGTLDRLTRMAGTDTGNTDDRARLHRLFSASISSFGTDTAEDLLRFATLVETVLKALPEGARPAVHNISLTDIAARVHGRLHKNGPRGRDALDIWTKRVDDAANAVWDMMGAMETTGISHMGQLVTMDEDAAFKRFFPKNARNVEPLARFMVASALHKEGLCFDYWRNDAPARARPVLTAGVF